MKVALEVGLDSTSIAAACEPLSTCLYTIDCPSLSSNQAEPERERELETVISEIL